VELRKHSLSSLASDGQEDLVWWTWLTGPGPIGNEMMFVFEEFIFEVF
jgi:hypothetical protein